MSSMKMTMVFNRNTIINRGNSVSQTKQNSNVPVVQNQSANIERKKVKSLFNLGGIMNLSTNCTPCKACGS